MNGSFETSTGVTAQGWTVTSNVYSGPYAAPCLAFTTGGASDGAFFVVWNTGDSIPLASLSQTIATTPGKAYTLKFDYVGGPPWRSDLQSLLVSVSNSDLATQTATGDPSGNWKTFSYSFVATSTSSTITFKDNPTNVTYSEDGALDNVSVVANVAADTTAPVLSLPVAVTAEATGPNGAAVTFDVSATDAIDGPVPVALSAAPGSVFSLGTTTVSASATDIAGNAASGSFGVTVSDTRAPAIVSLRPSVASLWPANHKMVAIKVAATAADAVGVTSLRIVSVASNEPDNGLGDGDTANDVQLTSALTLNLRAERSGSGTGRVYAITVEARDAAGNTSTMTTTVSVPLNQSGK